MVTVNERAARGQRRSGRKGAVVSAWGIAGVLGVVGLLLASGCNLAQVEPKPTRPFGEIEKSERGVVASVNDTMIDLRTGQVRGLRTSQPVPLGPVAVGLPITLGGEKKREVPGEEITVRLPSGKLVFVVQELSQPPFAVGEPVKVLHEKANVSGESRTKVVRDEY